MRGKIIVIEGTDCSGKQTQTDLLYEYLKNNNVKVAKFSFPMYDTPTGKIIAGPYLGRKEVSNTWFDEGAVNVDPKVASLYYAADRLYNIDKLNPLLEDGYVILLDRYVTSNMAHQGSKYENKEDRLAMYEFIENLEYNLLNLPKEYLTIFLHMPYKGVRELMKNREGTDSHEKDEDHILKSEKCYIELSMIYNFEIIECVSDRGIKTIDEISNEIINIVRKRIF